MKRIYIMLVFIIVLIDYGEAQEAQINTYKSKVTDTVNVLIIKSGVDTTLNSMLYVTGKVVCNGTLNTNGYLTLVSTSASTGFISNEGTGIINGDVTVQRYIPGQQNYSNISSPVSNGWSSNIYSFKRYLYINYNSPNESVVTLSLLDMAGQKIMKDMTITNGLTKLQPLVSQGLYIARLMSNNMVYSKKVYIE